MIRFFNTDFKKVMCFLLKYYEGGVNYDHIQHMRFSELVNLKAFADEQIEQERRQVEKIKR